MKFTKIGSDGVCPEISNITDWPETFRIDEVKDQINFEPNFNQG